LTFDDLTEEDIQHLQTPALQAKAEWDGVKPTIDRAISDATAAIEGATTATKSATASALNANAAATQARSQGNGAEERGKNAAKAADYANNRMVEINTEFSNKMDEVDSKVATAEAQFTTAISEINDAITNGERAVESIRGALTEVDNKIGEADTAILGANKAKDDANTAKNAANAAAEAANDVANDFLQAENQRVLNEEKRVDAETLREGAEILRAEAERNRAAIESGRVAAEIARVNAENAREVNAAKAISDMQKASTDAINEMKSTTNTTISNVNKVVSDAVTSADSATGRANTAANEAEEAAASANAAKESIQEELGAKADKTGEYKELTAGFAYEILGDGQATSEQFSFRPTGGPNRNVRDGSARIEVLKGNSVVWNQQLVHRTEVFIDGGITMTQDGTGRVTVQGTATKNFERTIGMANIISDRYYCLLGGPQNGSTETYFLSDQATLIDLGKGCIQKMTYNEDRFFVFYVNEGVTVDLVFSPEVHDLTQMFGAGNEPTTLEQFYEMLPEGVDINAYNEGEIVDANYKAIKTTGFNQWDEQWELGMFDTSTGEQEISFEHIRNVNPIRVLPNTTYYEKQPVADNLLMIVLEYTQDGTYIGFKYVYNITFTTSPNTAYVNFYMTRVYGPVYNNDICINIAWDEYSALNGKYKPYKPFERDLSWVNNYFPAKINGETKYGMRRAGNVADEIRFNSTNQQWEAVQRIGVVDLGSLDWIKQDRLDATITWRFRAKIDDSIQSDILNNMLCDKYIFDISPIGEENVDDSIVIYNGYLYVEDTSYTDATTFKAAMDGVMLNYELAEPIVTPITEDVNLAYDVADYGTEQLIVADGAQSAPLSAEVVYEPNVLATIKQVATMLNRLDTLEATVATMAASAVAVTNEE
jgi:hypothetical protein